MMPGELLAAYERVQKTHLPSTASINGVITVTHLDQLHLQPRLTTASTPQQPPTSLSSRANASPPLPPLPPVAPLPPMPEHLMTARQAGATGPPLTAQQIRTAPAAPTGLSMTEFRNGRWTAAVQREFFKKIFFGKRSAHTPASALYMLCQWQGQRDGQTGRSLWTIRETLEAHALELEAGGYCARVERVHGKSKKELKQQVHGRHLTHRMVLHTVGSHTSYGHTPHDHLISAL